MNYSGRSWASRAVRGSSVRRPVILACLVFLGYGLATTTIVNGAELASGYQLLADTGDFAGTIAAPRISPVDNAWISFEVHQSGRTKLFVYNTETLQTRRISPVLPVADSAQPDTARLIDCDFAWRPVRGSDGNIWGAFVSNLDGKFELYFYDLTHDEYHLFESELDSDGTASKREPRWSPDGKCLNYTATEGDDQEIRLIRMVDLVLADHASGYHTGTEDRLINDEGSQSGGVWCPVEGSGYLAYEQWQDGTPRSEVRIWDLRYSRSLRLTQSDGTMLMANTVAPSWAPGGLRLAYFRCMTDVEGDSSGDDSGTCATGFAALLQRGESFHTAFTADLVAAYKPTTTSDSSRLLGSTWSSDGQYLLLSDRAAGDSSGIHAVDVQRYSSQDPNRSWLKAVDGTQGFRQVSDVALVRGRLAFAGVTDSGQALVIGDIVLDRSLRRPQDMLTIPREREDWWEAYTGLPKRNFLSAVGDFLWRPLIGDRDIGVNRGIALVVAGVVVSYLVIDQFSGDDGVVTPRRDWTPPEFPDGTQSKSRLAVGFRF